MINSFKQYSSEYLAIEYNGEETIDEIESFLKDNHILKDIIYNGEVLKIDTVKRDTNIYNCTIYMYELEDILVYNISDDTIFVVNKYHSNKYGF